MSQVKRDGWFTNYAASRNLAERTRHFTLEDFHSATVLDIGCNTGQMSQQAIAWGARHVLGVDYDRDAIQIARAQAGNANITYSVEDVDLPGAWRSIPRVDLVMFLAVYLTRELENREAILANAAAKCRRTFYFEGHAHQTQGYGVAEYVRDILKFTTFDQIEYLGNSDGPGFRPVIRCTRGAMGMIDGANKLMECAKKYDKVVVVGKSAAGKTAMCERVRQLGIESFTYDDVPPPYNEKRFVLFDWRGMEYVETAPCVFYVVCDESERQKRIDDCPVKDRLLRTSPGVPTCAKAIFTVRL